MRRPSNTAGLDPALVSIPSSAADGNYQVVFHLTTANGTTLPNVVEDIGVAAAGDLTGGQTVTVLPVNGANEDRVPRLGVERTLDRHGDDQLHRCSSQK